MALKTLQKGTKTLADGVASMTIVAGVDTGFDAAVDATKTILWGSARCNGTTQVDAGVTWELNAAGDTITVTRSSVVTPVGEVFFEFKLEEHESGLVAQPVSIVIAASTQGGTDAIDAPSIGGGRFIVPCGCLVNSTGTEHTLVRWRFDSDTQVSANRAVATSVGVTVKALVVERENCTVQTVDFTLTNNIDLLHDQAITAVADLAKTMIIGTGNVTGTGNHRDTFWSVDLTTTTNLRFERFNNTSATFNFTIFVVEFSDATVVQRTAYSMSTVNQADVTITAVDLTRAVAMQIGIGSWMSIGRTTEFSSQASDAFVSNRLTTATNHRLQKEADTVGSAFGISQVVEVPAAAAGSAPAPASLARGLARGLTRGLH